MNKSIKKKKEEMEPDDDDDDGVELLTTIQQIKQIKKKMKDQCVVT